MVPITRDYRDFLALLVKHEVRFLVAGGFALAAHGHPRFTKDIDIWVEPTPDNARRLLAALDEFGDVDVPILDRASLITNKRAVGRPQDLADVAMLETDPEGT